MSQTPADWCKKGDNLKRSGATQEAIEAYDQAIALDPDFGRAYYLKALVLDEQGNKAEAIELYKKSTSLGYQTAPGYVKIGLCYKNSGQLTEALEAYNQALILDPNNSQAYTNRGLAYMNMGKLEEALADYQNVEKIKGATIDICLKIGSVLDPLGRKEEALKYFDLCLSMDSYNFKGNARKGGFLVREGKYQEAIQYLEKALVVALDPPSIYHMAIAYTNLGDTEKANEYYSKGEGLNPKTASGHCYKGQCYYALGQKEKAFEEFKIAKEQFETDTKANLIPAAVENLKKTLKSILEAEEIAKQAEEAVKKLDQNNPLAQKWIMTLKKLQKNQLQAEEKVIGQLGQNETNQEDKNLNELERIKEEFKKELSMMKQEISELRTDVKEVKDEVKELKNEMVELKNEMDTKMDDFSKKIEVELGKEGLSDEEKAKLMEYFRAFACTFSSIYVTSQVIDSGQVSLDVGNTTATVLSFFASLIPIIGAQAADGINSISEFMMAKEMKVNARRMKGLAPDGTLLSQLVGKTALEVLKNKQKQQQIINTTPEDLKEASISTFQKLSQLCRDMGDSVDIYLYTELYTSAPEQLAHNDVNILMEKYMKTEIDRRYGDMQKQLANGILQGLQTKPVEEESPSPAKVNEDKNLTDLETIATPGTEPRQCCNMF